MIRARLEETMSHILMQDPSDLAARFSNKDRLGYEGDGSDLEIDAIIERELSPIPEEVMQSDDNFEFTSVEKYLHRIPSREKDLISLYYRDRMKQEQIARLFGITQAAVSYRLHRGIKRIQFLRTIPELEYETFELELGPKFSIQDLEILWRMYETTCQSAIAKEMHLTQGRVRHRFFRSLSRIKELIIEEVRVREAELKHMACNGVSLSEEKHKMELDKIVEESRYGKYWTMFYAISDRHFNILHEVSLPQFRNRGDAQIISADV